MTTPAGLTSSNHTVAVRPMISGGPDVTCGFAMAALPSPVNQWCCTGEPNFPRFAALPTANDVDVIDV